MNQVRGNHKAAGRAGRDGAHAGEAMRVDKLRVRAIGAAQRSRLGMR
jgi:hypothetical protein